MRPPFLPPENTFATLPGIVTPLIVASLVNVEARDDQSKWQTVFALSATVSLVGVVVYVAGVRVDLDPALAFADAREGDAARGLLDGDGIEAVEW